MLTLYVLKNVRGKLSFETAQVLKYGEAAPFDPATLPICYSHTPPPPIWKSGNREISFSRAIELDTLESKQQMISSGAKVHAGPRFFACDCQFRRFIAERFSMAKHGSLGRGFQLGKGIRAFGASIGKAYE